MPVTINGTTGINSPGGTFTGAVTTNGLSNEMTTFNQLTTQVSNDNQVGVRIRRTGGTNTMGWEIYNQAGDTTKALRFYESADRMILDSSGRLTTPFQTAFLAVATGGGGSVGTGNYTSYLSTPINVGSGFNTSTGRFTAPVAGTYLVFVHANATGASGGTPTRIQILKNGSSVPTSNNQIRAGNSDLTYDMSMLVSLAVNDYINVYSIPGSANMTDDSAYNFFGGYLLG